MARTTAARPSAGPVIGYQRWDSLLFLHWAVPPAVLRPLVPARLDIDTFDGRAWVGMTPFTMAGARVRPLPPLPSLAAFHELNVRTYVRRGGRDPGVWFFSLDAASLPAVAIARAMLRLPYFPAAMTRARDGDRFRYSSDRRFPPHGRFRASWRVDGPAREATPGSGEHFLVERYVLYSRAVDGLLWRGQVAQLPWRLRPVADLEVEQTLDRADGLPALDGAPLAHYSDGVDTRVLAFAPV